MNLNIPDRPKPQDVPCVLCPKKGGALKATNTGKWAHVVCGLYNPLANFGDTDTMSPIIIPNFQKAVCGALDDFVLKRCF